MTEGSTSVLAVVAPFVLGVLVTAFVGWWSTHQMNKSFRESRNLISQITGLFKASQMVGIDTAYENRGVALLERDVTGEDAGSFLHHLKDDSKLIVVGSSLLGLRTYVPRLGQYIQARKANNWETKFLLTHPCFSNSREDQEKRSEGQIRKEIQGTIDFLTDCGLDLDGCLRFYKGTPTCFMIVTSNAMLLNPYPYQTEAYKAFCLEVRRLERSQVDVAKTSATTDDILRSIDAKRFRQDIEREMKDPAWSQYDYSGDVGPDIYGQFYWYHYFLPWFSKQAVTMNEYKETCEHCPCLDSGYTGECVLHGDEILTSRGIGKRIREAALSEDTVTS